MASAKAGLYLRKGPVVTPGIMTLTDTVLSFRTVSGSLFEAPVSELRAEFSRYGTLTIFRGTEKFIFVTGGYAGVFAPNFSDEQLREIAETDTQVAIPSQFKRGASVLVSGAVVRDLSVLVGSVAGQFIGSFGKLVGVIKVTQSQRTAFYLSKAWVEYLQQHGLSVTMKGTTFASSQRTIAAILIPAFVAAGVLIYFIVWAISGT